MDGATEELNFKLHLTAINFNSYKRLVATVLSLSRQMSEYASYWVCTDLRTGT